MPTDAAIPLSVKPIIVPDAAKQFAESEGLAQQRALRNQQLQEGSIALQEKAQEQQDQLKLRKVYQDANGDPEKTVRGAISAGVSPKSVQGLQQHFADYAAKIAKTKADELPIIAARDNKMLGLHDEAIQLATTNPQKFAEQYPSFYARAVQIDPEAANHLDPNTPPTVDQLGLSKLGYQTHTTFLAQEEEKRKRAAEAQAVIQRPLQTTQLTNTITEQQGAIAAQKKKVQDEKDADNAKLLAAASAGGPAQVAATLKTLQSKGEDISKFTGIPMDAKPDAFLRVAMQPHEIMTADIAAKNAENNVSEYELELRAAKGDAAAKTALANRQKDKIAAAIASRDPNAAGLRQTAQLDHEINQFGKPYEDMTKANDAQLEKILEAEKLVAGGSVSQAMAIPKVLQSIMATGQAAGTGVRSTINNAEMERIEKARGVVGGLESFLSRISGQGSLTADQKKQMSGILSDVRDRIVQKKIIANGASDEMRSATSREDVLAADKKARASLAAHQAAGSFTEAKVATMDQVRAYARTHKISEAAAKKAAEDDGFTVK